MNLTRRKILGWGTVLFSGATVGFAGFGLMCRKARAEVLGPLVPDPNGILDLPEGFSYRILKVTGDALNDGTVMRGRQDGMAAFPGQNPEEVILLLNHELDAGAGGVSRLVVNTTTLEVVSGNQVLTGTSRNCAGGPSPWGWLSCEEVPTGGVWVCPVDATAALGAPKRIDDYGSFQHEAVCIDPDTLIAYLTEDEGSSHLYRMVPTNPAVDPHLGQLQALKVIAQDDYDTRVSNMSLGQEVDVEWVNVNPASARADAKTNRAAIIERGEGIWWFDGSVYFTATTDHQIFELIPTPTGGKLRLVSVGDSTSPDNITVSPWGSLYVAEDPVGGTAARVQMIDAQGNVSTFARNAEAMNSELAGTCFSPDGRILFVNMQGAGRTLAIVGPFPVADEPGDLDGGAAGSAGSTDSAGSGGEAGSAGSVGGAAGSGPSEPPLGDPNAAGGGASGSAGNGSSPDSTKKQGGGCAVANSSSRLSSAIALGTAAGAALLRRVGKLPD